MRGVGVAGRSVTVAPVTTLFVLAQGLHQQLHQGNLDAKEIERATAGQVSVRVCVCVCVCGERVCVCMWRGRERERVCVCVCMCVCGECVCVCGERE